MSINARRVRFAHVHQENRIDTISCLYQSSSFTVDQYGWCALKRDGVRAWPITSILVTVLTGIRDMMELTGLPSADEQIFSLIQGFCMQSLIVTGLAKDLCPSQ